MTIENYLSEPLRNRIEIVKQANLKTAPFWLAQLQTAVVMHSPIGLTFLDKRLGAEYWALISKN